MSLISVSKCFAGAVNLLQVRREILLSEVFGFLLEHLAVANDGVERRAQFVAHAREKLGLGLARLGGGFLGSAQFHIFVSISAFACCAASSARCSSSNNCSRNCSASRLRLMTSDRATSAQTSRPPVVPPNGPMIHALRYHGGTILSGTNVGSE